LYRSGGFVDASGPEEALRQTLEIAGLLVDGVILDVEKIRQ
jgi:hypothetical protein